MVDLVVLLILGVGCWVWLLDVRLWVILGFLCIMMVWGVLWYLVLFRFDVCVDSDCFWFVWCWLLFSVACGCLCVG